MVEKQSKDYLLGVPELLILRLLHDQEMYGYEIVQGIKNRSSNQISFAEGVIYPLLHSMQKKRLLAIRRQKVNGRIRIYYRLTNNGRKKLESKQSEWTRVIRSVQMILDGGSGENSTAYRALP